MIETRLEKITKHVRYMLHGWIHMKFNIFLFVLFQKLFNYTTTTACFKVFKYPQHLKTRCFHVSIELQSPPPIFQHIFFAITVAFDFTGTLIVYNCGKQCFQAACFVPCVPTSQGNYSYLYYARFLSNKTPYFIFIGKEIERRKRVTRNQ